MQKQSQTIKEAYSFYKTTTEHPVDRKLFEDICKEFNIKLFDLVLDGYEFDMGSNMGTISIRRIERYPGKLTVDWGETNKLKRELVDQGVKLYDSATGEGEKYQVYYTDKFYCKYHWTKSKCKVKNKTVYRFSPTRGKKGNKEKLVDLLHKDDLAYLRFKKDGIQINK
jgi:hypothetical protein